MRGRLGFWLTVARLAGLLGLFFVVPPGAAQTPPASGHQVFLPIVLQNASLPGVPGTFATSLTFQTAFRGTGVNVDFFRSDGSRAVPAFTYAFPLTQYESRTLYLPALADLPPGQYAAFVFSDFPLTVLANVSSQSPNLAASYTGAVQHETGRTVAVPAVYNGYAGQYTSILIVQNASAAFNATPVPAQVVLSYRDAAGQAVGRTAERTVAANGFATFMAVDAGLPAGFVGSATITSDQPVVATAVVSAAAGELAAVGGVAADSQAFAPPTAATVYAPAVYKNYLSDRWMSALLVHNVDATPATVEVTFSGTGLGAPVVLTDTLPPGTGRHYWQGNTPAGLPDGFVGAAVVRSVGGQRLTAVVNTRNAAGDLASYRGLATADSVVRFPALFREFTALRWRSSFLVQNVDAVPAELTITYRGADGGVVAQTTATVQPGQVHLRYLPGEPSLPDGFAGSASVVSNGARLAGVANTLSAGLTGGDRLMAYEEACC